MVIGKLFRQLRLRQAAVDDVQNFLYIVFLLHGLPPCPPLKMGTKIHRVLPKAPAVYQGHMQFRTRQTHLPCPHRRRSVVSGDRYCRCSYGKLLLRSLKNSAFRPRYNTTPGWILQPILQKFYCFLSGISTPVFLLGFWRQKEYTGHRKYCAKGVHDHAGNHP